MRHFYNPSNFGITVTLLLFGWVGIAPPYQFTGNLDRIGDWLLPGIIVCHGNFSQRAIHASSAVDCRLARMASSRRPSSGLWCSVRRWRGAAADDGDGFYSLHLLHGDRPGHHTLGKRSQIAFGAGVAVVYGLLMTMHIVFGLFFALTIVCTVRGLGLYAVGVGRAKKANQDGSLRRRRRLPRRCKRWSPR